MLRKRSTALRAHCAVAVFCITFVVNAVAENWCTAKSNDGNYSLDSDCRVDITSVKSTCNISRQEVPLNDDDYPTCIGSGCSGARRLNTKQSITYKWDSAICVSSGKVLTITGVPGTGGKLPTIYPGCSSDQCYGRWATQ